MCVCVFCAAVTGRKLKCVCVCVFCGAVTGRKLKCVFVCVLHCSYRVKAEVCVCTCVFVGRRVLERLLIIRKHARLKNSKWLNVSGLNDGFTCNFKL